MTRSARIRSFDTRTGYGTVRFADELTPPFGFFTTESFARLTCESELRRGRAVVCVTTQPDGRMASVASIELAG